MDSVSFCCIVCGVPIHYDQDSGQDSWLGQFRIVYVKSGTVYLSGIGLRVNADRPSWSAPLDEGMPWDDPNYDDEANDHIPVMRQPPIDGRHGFVLHDACSRLLKAAFDPESVPLERLSRVCESLPNPLFWQGVCWDHDYGGVALLDERDHYPFEDRLTECTSSTEEIRNAQTNPYDVADVFRSLIVPSDPSLNLMPPPETSKSFAGILTSQTFWALRFAPGRERDFVFEMRERKKGVDWKLLYRCTSAACASPAMKNRKRIWSLIQTIKEYLGLHVDEMQRDAYADMNDLDLRWSQVRGDILRQPGFYEGSRIFHQARTFIPESLSKVAFSVVRAGEADYVVGLRLISIGTDDRQLGYSVEGKECFFEVQALKGFAVAVGPRGIRALQVICDDGTRSPWFGRPKNSPITERLARTQCISALEVGFDGYKLVTLAVAKAAGPLDQISQLKELSLRHDSLWYPTIPDMDLCLNELSFIGEPPPLSKYRPLSWILFGGPKGIYLRHLTQVTVNLLGCPNSIEFDYDTDGIVPEKRLGRLPIDDRSKSYRFPIDGPGREIITELATSVEQIDMEDSFFGHRKLISFMVRAAFPTD